MGPASSPACLPACLAKGYVGFSPVLLWWRHPRLITDRFLMPGLILSMSLGTRLYVRCMLESEHVASKKVDGCGCMHTFQLGTQR